MSIWWRDTRQNRETGWTAGIKAKLSNHCRAHAFCQILSAARGFGSYRLAVTKSYTQVALEMGNSPEKVRSNYNDPKAETEGLEYFAISRAAPENVITMPLALEFA